MGMTNKYSVYSEFDIRKHKETYVHYLEVVIDEFGTVHYAVPSHQEFLISNCMKTLNWARQELSNACPEEYYFDFVTWLCKMSGCVSVWENFIQFWDISDIQLSKLRELQDEGLYLGEIPDAPINIEEYRLNGMEKLYG